MKQTNKRTPPTMISRAQVNEQQRTKGNPEFGLHHLCPPATQEENDPKQTLRLVLAFPSRSRSDLRL